MVADGVDVWKIRSEGNVDFRVSKNIFKKMEKTFSGCKEAGSVEEIVRRAERMAIKKQANRTNAAEWFEEYVSSSFSKSPFLLPVLWSVQCLFFLTSVLLTGKKKSTLSTLGEYHSIFSFIQFFQSFFLCVFFLFCFC